MATFSIVLFISLFSIGLCISLASVKHINSVKDIPCQIPQRRFIHLKELLSENAWKDKYEEVVKNIKPPGTFVHQCLSSGCCLNYKKSCQPKRTEEVTITFGIFGKTISEFDIKITNHTECWCRDMEKIEKNLIK